MIGGSNSAAPSLQDFLELADEVFDDDGVTHWVNSLRIWSTCANIISLEIEKASRI